MASTGSPARPAPAGQTAEAHDDIIYPTMIPFLLVHLSLIGLFWTGVSATALWLCFALYVIRMFGVTAGFHRYFSHRTYKTSRVGQFAMAWLAQSSGQKGVLWWAAMHREHHRYSDTPEDVHSPRHRGFFYSHLGWIFSRRDSNADYSQIPDLTRYPELVWLDRNHQLPALVLGVAVFLIWGWVGLFAGFFLSTVLLYHGTFMINSLAHVSGKQRYITGDDSRNNWLLSLVTLGEGWHNNHHYYQTATRQGFRWWEIDITYYTLRLLSVPRLVWGLRSVPNDVIQAQRPLGNGVLERVAHQLAESFPLDRMADNLREHWQDRIDSLEASSLEARRKLGQWQDAIVELSRKELPSLEELREKARTMLPETPQLDQIVERGRQVMLENVSRRLLEGGGRPTPA